MSGRPCCMRQLAMAVCAWPPVCVSRCWRRCGCDAANSRRRSLPPARQRMCWRARLSWPSCCGDGLPGRCGACYCGWASCSTRWLPAGILALARQPGLAIGRCCSMLSARLLRGGSPPSWLPWLPITRACVRLRGYFAGSAGREQRRRLGFGGGRCWRVRAPRSWPARRR